MIVIRHNTKKMQTKYLVIQVTKILNHLEALFEISSTDEEFNKLKC